MLSNTNVSQLNNGNNGDKLIGNWMSEGKDLIVNCYKIDNKYYGKLIWFKEYNDDEHGPQEGGVPKEKWINSIVLKNLVYQNDKWINGQILDLTTGQTYSNEVEMSSKEEIKVTGYILFPIFGKSLNFTKY